MRNFVIFGYATVRAIYTLKKFVSPQSGSCLACPLEVPRANGGGSNVARATIYEARGGGRAARAAAALRDLSHWVYIASQSRWRVVQSTRTRHSRVLHLILIRFVLFWQRDRKNISSWSIVLWRISSFLTTAKAASAEFSHMEVCFQQGVYWVRCPSCRIVLYLMFSSQTRTHDCADGKFR